MHYTTDTLDNASSQSRAENSFMHRPEKVKKSASKSNQEKKPKQVNVNTGDYKAPEYYQHNAMSFNDFMVEMQKYRLPQPSNKSQ
ncbi:uncharacterized protein B4U80_06452 [Leptotrombidium deliense]|uniref:Uncharacterized protein n=1 Tax=Leptotrombidium deliense TaxID=299467 RepID=A0A443SS20_9ACAR|nr:uncharacterized protein B4U80_06452 [Leptotrombidium deliense]